VALADLPEYVQEIAAALMRERGWAEPKATNVAIATVRRFCATGRSPNLRGVQVGSDARARACAAVREMDTAKAAPEEPSAPEEPAMPEEPVTEEPLPSPEAYSVSEWKRAAILDRGPEIEDVRERFGLPVRTPDGVVSRHAVHDVAAVLVALKAKPSILAAAARKLLRVFALVAATPPKAVVQMAEEARALTGEVEERSAPDLLTVEGRKLRGVIPYGVESRDLGGWTEVMQPGCLSRADLSDLVATVDHAGLPLGRYPDTLILEEREDGMRWSVELPESRADVREAVERGDLRAGSWRMVVARDRWEGNRRYVEEVRALRDVAVVTVPAYPQAVAELRAAPETETEEGEAMDVVEVEEAVEAALDQEVVEDRSAPAGGGLRVEDRVEGGVEQRSLHELFRRAGWTPDARASITFPEFMGALEQRGLTLDGINSADVAPIRREGVPFGSDNRYAWPVFASVAVDAGTTSIAVLRQTARTLPDPADVIRAIDSDQPKAEADSTITLVSVPMLGVAAVQQQVPNIWIEHDQIRTVIGQDLRLSINEALDSLVLAALADADVQPPGSDALLVSIRKAITLVQAEGYNPDTLVLRPADSEALDVLTTSGPEEAYVFGPARFAPGQLFGLSVRVSKSADSPVVLDSQAVGRLYVSPLSLQRFEENNGTTNTSTMRLEGTAQFGTERIAAARRIAAS
jgi:HK97 family phage prohead protease